MHYGRFIVIIAAITLVEWLVYALRGPLGIVDSGRLVPLLLGTSAVKFLLVIYWVMKHLQTTGITPPGAQKIAASLLVMGGGTILILWILLAGQPLPS
jgi:hypothetical protein